MQKVSQRQWNCWTPAIWMWIPVDYLSESSGENITVTSRGSEFDGDNSNCVFESIDSESEDQNTDNASVLPEKRPWVQSIWDWTKWTIHIKVPIFLLVVIGQLSTTYRVFQKHLNSFLLMPSCQKLQMKQTVVARHL